MTGDNTPCKMCPVAQRPNCLLVGRWCLPTVRRPSPVCRLPLRTAPQAKHGPPCSVFFVLVLGLCSFFLFWFFSSLPSMRLAASAFFAVSSAASAASTAKNLTYCAYWRARDAATQVKEWSVFSNLCAAIEPASPHTCGATLEELPRASARKGAKVLVLHVHVRA